MKAFFLMLGFLTRLPAPYVVYDEEVYQEGIGYMPLIGLIIGLILWITASLGSLLHLEGLLPFLLPLVYIMLTGGIHLDGLADTSDGIFSGRDRDGMLFIMKDSRIGTFGVISLIVWFLFYMTIFPMVQLQWLVLMPVIGKSAMIISAYIAPCARPEGMGRVFIEGCQKTQVFIALLIPLLICLFLWDIYMFLIMAACYPVAVGITRSIQRKLGGVTGDTLGFVCEVTQMIFLFTASALAGIFTAFF